MDYSEAKHIDQDTQVTVGEVRAAMERVIPEHFDDVTAHEAGLLASDVIRSIFNGRERKWRAGDIVRDAENAGWQRVSGPQWKKMGRAGLYSHSRPVRPLTLLWSPQDVADEARRLKSMERARDDGMPA